MHGRSPWCLRTSPAVSRCEGSSGLTGLCNTSRVRLETEGSGPDPEAKRQTAGLFLPAAPLEVKGAPRALRSHVVIPASLCPHLLSLVRRRGHHMAPSLPTWSAVAGRTPRLQLFCFIITHAQSSVKQSISPHSQMFLQAAQLWVTFIFSGTTRQIVL